MIEPIYAVQIIGLKSSEWELSLFSECNLCLHSGICPPHFTFTAIDGLCFHDGGELRRDAGVKYCAKVGSGLILVSSANMEFFRFVFTISIFNHLYKYLDIMYIEYKQYCKLNFYLLNCKSKNLFYDN